jgi:hypothetical protein
MSALRGLWVGAITWISTALLASAVHAAATLPHYAVAKTLGVASCSNSLCHGATEYWKGSNVLQNEYLTWHRTDKHARAYSVLLNEQSKGIAMKLGLAKPAHESDVCLDCHTHNVPANRRGDKFVLADGVMCEACHGPAERWLRSHVEPSATHARNIAHGLYPTGNDIERARLCLSCHFGNAQKFVTHRIMAAGHPRMSFELDTFTQIEPAHWRIDADWVKRKGEWNGVRAWAVGQALAAQALLSILIDPERGRDGLFPELVLFDCHSCHHPMAEKRNTAARLKAGPGWVRLNDASLLMLRHIARRVDTAGAAAFEAQVDRLHKSIASRNDGIVQARAMIEMIDALLVRIGTHRFSHDDLRAILSSLINDGLGGQYADYQGAEQASMAVQSVADMLRRRGELRTSGLGPAMRKLMNSVAADEQYRAADFQAALRDLRVALTAGAKQ